MADRRYFGCFVRQRQADDTVPFFVFLAKAKDLKEWAGTRRTAEVPSGTQRLLRETRVHAIKRFLGSNARNTIPNSILLAFEPETARFVALEKDCVDEPSFYNNCDESELQWGFLEFAFVENAPEDQRAALIVDGQHRVTGISTFEGENLPILIVGLVDANHQEQAFQFIVVNDKAVRVPTENVKSIIADIDEADLQNRLLSAGIRYGAASPKLKDINDLDTSPFKGLLDWDYNRTGTKLVPVTAIEQQMKFLNGTFGNVIGDDEGSEIDIYCAIWSGIQSVYTELWGREGKLMTKVNLSAMNELTIKRLKTLWSMDLLNVFDTDEVKQQVRKMWEPIPQDFWTLEWTMRPQDNTAFREYIQRDIELIAENKRLKKPWYAQLTLLDVEDLGADSPD